MRRCSFCSNFLSFPFLRGIARELEWITILMNGRNESSLCLTNILPGSNECLSPRVMENRGLSDWNNRWMHTSGSILVDLAPKCNLWHLRHSLRKSIRLQLSLLLHSFLSSKQRGLLDAREIDWLKKEKRLEANWKDISAASAIVCSASGATRVAEVPLLLGYDWLQAGGRLLEDITLIPLPPSA